MTTTSATATEPLPTLPEARERSREIANLTRAAVGDVVHAVADMLAPASLAQFRRAAANVTTASAALEQMTQPTSMRHALGTLILRTVEFRALLEEHPDGLSRAVWVMQQSACAILGDDAGQPVSEWCGALLAGDGT